jgi:diguanylate cyclase (GGDEF)-like protein
MHIDVPTLMVVNGFVAICAAAVLLFARFMDRKTTVPTDWGIAFIFFAGGLFSLMMGATLRQPLLSIVGGTLMVLAHGLIWRAARLLDGKPAPLIVAISGTIFVVIVGATVGSRPLNASLDLAGGAGYALAAAVTLWLGRGEKLFMRWPLIVVLAVHSTILFIGTHSTVFGLMSPDQVPLVMSLFGLVHLDSTIFAIGATVFVLLMIKERSEIAGKIAASIDPLTGIANRAAFLEKAECIMQRCRREAAPVSIIMFDLDRFKTINDTFGHAVGDVVIQSFCKSVTAALRSNDVFGRLGGEEFAAVLPGSDIEATRARANLIRAGFAESGRFIMGKSANATVSGGVAVSPDTQLTLSALLELADEALYAAKAEGRNRINCADRPKSESDASNVVRVA